MLEGTAYRQLRSTPLCWLNNGAPAESLPRCLGLLNSGTVANPPAREGNLTITYTMLQHLWFHEHVRVTSTHISSWFLQILVIHLGWDDLRGQRTGGVWLRQLPFKLRLNEVQLPAGEEKSRHLAGK